MKLRDLPPAARTAFWLFLIFSLGAVGTSLVDRDHWAARGLTVAGIIFLAIFIMLLKPRSSA